MSKNVLSRRLFVRQTFITAALAPLVAQELLAQSNQEEHQKPRNVGDPKRQDARVALVKCRGYGAEVRPALAKGFDLLGGIGTLVRNKSITIKLNLTGTDFSSFLGLPVGETYMTHFDTARELAALLFAAGAKRLCFAESTTSVGGLAESLVTAKWDVKALQALGSVEFENTRNLGTGKRYSHLQVPGGGYMFSAFDFNRAYAETDVVISLAKLKQHLTTGVTLSLKNMFGITPNALYGDDAVDEAATSGRGELHSPTKKLKLPSLKPGITSVEAGWRVPRIVADICAARPVHLAVIDGITAMSGGEGPWCQNAGPMKVTRPGVLIIGLNPVSTDAVATALMGYANPRAVRPTKPFEFCDNHLLLAEQAGVGTADLSRIDCRGLPLEQAKYPYA
jgi:uncharacterized protein (DUF362 family)